MLRAKPVAIVSTEKNSVAPTSTDAGRLCPQACQTAARRAELRSSRPRKRARARAPVRSSRAVRPDRRIPWPERRTRP
jgi:hypothetical protein